MKILYIASAVSVHTRRWADAMTDRGHEAHVACNADHRPGDNEPWVTKAAVHVLPFGGTIGYYRNKAALKRVFDNLRPDIVNAHYASGYGTLARRSGVRPRFAVAQLNPAFSQRNARYSP